MRHTPAHAVDDEQTVRRLIAENPWATIVSTNGGELVASHYPVLLDERDDDQLAIVTHVGRPDDQVHDLGSGEVLLIVAGVSGYISPSWYSETPTARRPGTSASPTATACPSCWSPTRTCAS